MADALLSFYLAAPPSSGSLPTWDEMSPTSWCRCWCSSSRWRAAARICACCLPASDKGTRTLQGVAFLTLFSARAGGCATSSANHFISVLASSLDSGHWIGTIYTTPSADGSPSTLVAVNLLPTTTFSLWGRVPSSLNHLYFVLPSSPPGFRLTPQLTSGSWHFEGSLLGVALGYVVLWPTVLNCLLRPAPSVFPPAGAFPLSSEPQLSISPSTRPSAAPDSPI